MSIIKGFFVDFSYGKITLIIGIALRIYLQNQKYQRPRIFLYTPRWSWGHVYSFLNSAKLSLFSEVMLTRVHGVSMYILYIGIASPSIWKCLHMTLGMIQVWTFELRPFDSLQSVPAHGCLSAMLSVGCCAVLLLVLVILCRRTKFPYICHVTVS